MDFKLLGMMCKLTCGLQQGASGCLPSGLPSRRLRAGSAACRTVWVVHESQFTTAAGGTGRQHCQRPMPPRCAAAAPPKACDRPAARITRTPTPRSPLSSTSQPCRRSPLRATTRSRRGPWRPSGAPPGPSAASTTTGGATREWAVGVGTLHNPLSARSQTISEAQLETPAAPRSPASCPRAAGSTGRPQLPTRRAMTGSRRRASRCVAPSVPPSRDRAASTAANHTVPTLLALPVAWHGRHAPGSPRRNARSGACAPIIAGTTWHRRRGPACGGTARDHGDEGGEGDRLLLRWIECLLGLLLVQAGARHAACT